MRPVLFAEDRQFWFETLRILGHAAYGGSDIGEVLSTAEAITSGDYDSWHDAWRATGDRVGAQAELSLAGEHRVSARDGMLRAATYYSAAEFFLHGDPEDPRINDAYERGAACFATAAGLYRPVIEPVRIPYEATVLEGWFYRSSLDGAPRPTVVLHNGFDGSAEELHYLGGLAALDRGYNALSFDGPGQPSAIHRRGPVLRPDWEHVVGPVLDHLETLPGVDHDRVALMGVSLGGMLAPRAAAHEPRLAAVVAVDGVYDAAEALTGLLPHDHTSARRGVRMNLREMSDRLEIQDTVHQLVRGFDRRDWHIVEHLLADTVDSDYTAMLGGVVQTRTAAEQTRYYREHLGPLDATMHAATTLLIDLDGDTATASVNILTWLRREAAHDGPMWSNGATGKIQLIRTADRWRICRITVRPVWADGNMGVLDPVG